jgi:hypothetical protein
VLAAFETRCACGLDFIPGRPAPFEPAPREARAPRATRPDPLPPSVIYLATGTPGVPVPLGRAESETAMFDATDRAGAGDPGKTVGAAKHTPASGPAGAAVVPFGPPPTYRPIDPGPRPKLPAVEMTPVPPPTAVNLRTMGTLGPPPPYRPIIQAGATFARGGAPDLEPWRLASLMSTPGEDHEPRPGIIEEVWSLAREPPSEGAPIPGPEVPNRFENDRDVDPKDRPVAWAAHMPVPPATLGYAPEDKARRRGTGIRLRPRMGRSVLWASGLFGAILAVGAVTWLGFSAASGRFSGPTVAIGSRSGAVPVSAADKCAAPQQSSNSRAVGPDAGCANDPPAAETK